VVGWGWGVKQLTHQVHCLHLVQRLRTSGAVFLLPVCPHCGQGQLYYYICVIEFLYMDIIKIFGFSKWNNQYTNQAMHWKTKQFWLNFWPKHTDWLWSQPSSLFNGQSMRMTKCYHLVLKLGMYGIIPHFSPIFLQMCTGTSLHLLFQFSNQLGHMVKLTQTIQHV
jgi:hypothetical protein